MAFVVATDDLGTRLWYELHGLYNVDSEIYWAVSRGILNGLVPYRDLFETKPPGIFLLNAASIRTFGDETLARFVEVFVLAGLPAVVLGIVGKRERMVMLGVLLFGFVLALFVAQDSGEMQTESFGAFFASLYLLLAFTPRIGHWATVMFSGVFMAAAIGMKEPFVLSMVAAALLLSISLRDFMRRFVAPLGIAIGIGFVALAWLGYLQPYFEIYLPHMLGFHAHRFGSPTLRAFDVVPTLWNLWSYSPFFALLIAGAWFWQGWVAVKASAVRLIVVLIAIYLTFFGIGTGGEFLDHHFIFAAPVYVALARCFVEKANRVEIAIAGVLVLLSIFVHARMDLASRLQREVTDRAVPEHAARELDALMDRCHVERYRIVGDLAAPIFGYTRHSPLGPAFFQFSLYMQIKFFKDSLVQNLLDAPLVVMSQHPRKELPEPVLRYVSENFTTKAPPCAGKYTFLPEHQILFRNGLE